MLAGVNRLVSSALAVFSFCMLVVVVAAELFTFSAVNVVDCAFSAFAIASTLLYIPINSSFERSGASCGAAFGISMLAPSGNRGVGLVLIMLRLIGFLE